MTVEEAISILTGNCAGDDEMAQATDVLLADHRRLKRLLNDRLPNGGMVSHEAKHSMMPTLKHDTE